MTSQSSALKPQPSVRLHIERLVLEGLPVESYQGPAFQAAFEGELSRLLSERGVPPTLAYGAARASIDGGRIRMGPETKPVNTAAQIAHAVYEGLYQ